MVSKIAKIIKKTPTKPANDRRNRRRKKSPLNVSSIVVASLRTCRCGLVKIFSKLSRNGTPKKAKISPRKHGYQLLHKIASAAVDDDDDRGLRCVLFPSVANCPLPPSTSPEKPTVFLDLDETLVHSQPNLPPERYDFVVQPVIDGARVDFYVSKRPFVDEFLEFLSEKFELVVFTAALEEYASLVVDRLDRKALISHRLYRTSCRETEGKLVKDLNATGRDLRKVVLVDDNPNSYSIQPENAIPIRPFTNDFSDSELQRLIEFFRRTDEYEDMREAVKRRLAEEQGEERL